MPLDPGNNMKAAEDFLQVVLQGHIAVAAETVCTASDRELTLAELSKPLLKVCENHIAITIKSKCFNKQ